MKNWLGRLQVIAQQDLVRALNQEPSYFTQQIKEKNPGLSAEQIVAAAEGHLLLMAVLDAGAPFDWKALRAAFERIEVAQPGFEMQLMEDLLGRLWREDADALQRIAPQVADAFTHRFIERADRITKAWRVYPKLAPVLATYLREQGDWVEAKRQVSRAAAWEVAHARRDLTTVLRWGHVPDFLRASGPEFDWLAKRVIRKVEAQLRAEAASAARQLRVKNALLADLFLAGDGETYLDDLIASEDINRLEDALLERLVPREREYWDLLRRILTDRESDQPVEFLAEVDEQIAQKMGIATVTARVYRSTILKKAEGLRRAAPD